MWFGSWSKPQLERTSAQAANTRRQPDAETEGATAGFGLRDATFGSGMVASPGPKTWNDSASKVLTELKWCPRSQPERVSEVTQQLELALELSGLKDMLLCRIPASVEEVAGRFPDLPLTDIENKYTNFSPSDGRSDG